MSPVDMGFLFACIAILKSTTRLFWSVGSSVAYSLPRFVFVIWRSLAGDGCNRVWLF